MIETKSRVKQGILKLTNLRKVDKSPKKKVTHKPNQEQEPKDSKATPIKLLSDADLHVKNLLSNYLLTIDIEEPKQFDIESKIKILNEQKSTGTVIKMLNLSEDEDVAWGKSKTKGPRSINKKRSEKGIAKKNTLVEGIHKQNGDLIGFNEKSISSTAYLNNSSDMSEVSIDINARAKDSDDGVYRSFKSFKTNSRKNYKKKAQTQSNRMTQEGFKKENSFTKHYQVGSSVNVNNKPFISDRYKKSSSLIIDDKYNEDENDIRNILPMSKKNFSEFNGICSKIQQNICIQPQKPVSPSTKAIAKKSFTINSDDDNEEAKKNEIRYRALSRTPLVYDSLSDEESDQEITETYYLEPTSFLRLLYDCLLIVLYAYSGFSTPFSLAFELNQQRRINFDFVMNIIIDFFFGVDLFLSFFTAYYDFEEQLVTDIESIAANYLRSWFTLDLLAAIPYYAFIEFYCLQYPQSKLAISTNNIFNSETLALVNLFKLVRLFKGFKILSANSFINYIKQILVELNLVSKWFRLYMTLLLFLFSTHLLSCIFIFFGFNYYPNWIVDQGLDPKNQFDIYVASIYFILLTVYSVGYGDISSINIPERLFNIILLIVGILIYSWTVSSLSRYYIDGDEKTMEFRRKNDLLQDIKINYEKMSSELFDKIQRFLHYQLNNEKIDCNDILDDLPIGLKNNLISEMYKPIIENFVFFKNFDSSDFKIKVILSLKPLLAIKNERLVNDGDVMEEIFFVKTGKLILEFPLPIVLSPELAKALDRTTLSLHPVGTVQEQLTMAMCKSNNYTLDDFDFKKQKEGKKTLSAPVLPEIKQQYVKIIDICRNEHFGDVLMFLNQRSPLRVKVKSQKAELFLLKKTDAVEISMSFPKIWRKIIRKSLFNMQQINRLINKSLKFFFRHYEGKDRMKLPKDGEPLTKGLKNSYFKQTIQFDGLYDIKDEDELKTIPSDHKSLKTLQVTSKSPSSKKSSMTEPFAKLIPCQEDTQKNSNDSGFMASKRQSISNTNSSNRTIIANICHKKVQIRDSAKRSCVPDDFLLKDAENILEDTYSCLLYKEEDINSEYYPNEGELKENILYTREYKENNERSIYTVDINVNRNKPSLSTSAANAPKPNESLIQFANETFKRTSNNKDKDNFNDNDKDKDDNYSNDKSEPIKHLRSNPVINSRHKTVISAQTLNKTIKLTHHQFSKIDKCEGVMFSLNDNTFNNKDNKDNETEKQEECCLSPPSIIPPIETIKNRRGSMVERGSLPNKKLDKCYLAWKFGATVLSPAFSPKILGEPLNLRKRKNSVNIEIPRNQNLLQRQSSLGQNGQSNKKGNNAKKLNLITANIQNNSLMLKNPEMFYSSLFSQVMNKEKERDETKELNKKLNEIMKLIQDNETE